MSLWRWLFGDKQAAPARPATPADPAYAEFSADDWDTAGLRMVSSRMRPRPWTMDELANAKANIAAMRAEYAEAQPIKLRKAIMEWLDYFDRDLDERRDRIAKRERVDRLMIGLIGKPRP